MQSTEVVVEHESEMNEQQVKYGIEMDKTKEEVWTRKDEKGGPKKACEWFGWGCNKLGMFLASPNGKVWIHAASFG